MSENRTELVRHRITGPLVGHVADMTAYDVRQAEPGRHRGLPTTGLTFVLPVGEPIDVAWAGDPVSRERRWSCVSGLHTVAAEIWHTGRQSGIQLTLTPAGARALLGVPAGAIAAELLSLSQVSPGLASLPERVAAPGTWARRLALVESVLAEAMCRRDAPPIKAELARAMTLLARGVGVLEVADDVGYSRRHLASLFRAELGVAPKEYHRLARFERSRPLLVAAALAGRPLVEAAVASGCADQAHLTREWVALAGCSPTAWLREELPFLQDAEPVAAAS